MMTRIVFTMILFSSGFYLEDHCHGVVEDESCNFENFLKNMLFHKTLLLSTSQAFFSPSVHRNTFSRHSIQNTFHGTPVEIFFSAQHSKYFSPPVAAVVSEPSARSHTAAASGDKKDYKIKDGDGEDNDDGDDDDDDSDDSDMIIIIQTSSSSGGEAGRARPTRGCRAELARLVIIVVVVVEVVVGVVVVVIIILAI